MDTDPPVLNLFTVIVRDMDKTLAFYGLLGLTSDAEPGSPHASISFPNGVSLDFDSVEFVPMWDSGWKGATGGSTLVSFSVASPEGVDALYAKLTQAGHPGRQQPFDAFWGARYAIVDDPDGNGVGLMSPIEAARKTWPPEPPPSGP
jgi:catechol 2,3-dioxygenase-like lactoylglutathione lyase family enzyme